MNFTKFCTNLPYKIIHPIYMILYGKLILIDWSWSWFDWKSFTLYIGNCIAKRMKFEAYVSWSSAWWLFLLLQVKGLSMEMSQDAWVKQQTQQASDRHQARIKTSPVSGSGNCEVHEAGPPPSHPATFAPIMPQYGLPLHGGSGNIGRYVPPSHVPMHQPAHRRPAPPKPSPSQSPHARNYR